MEEINKYIPLDKSWIIRMGILDLINEKKDIIDFLEKQPNLNDDLLALKRIAENWNTSEPLDVGEAGTLYRFVRFTLWKIKKEKEIIKRGTLKDRKICNDSEIINWPLKKLLTLDNNTSQWASASVLNGNIEEVENSPVKLQLSYEAVRHWNEMRKQGKCWQPRFDETIKKQAEAFVELLKTGKLEFEPKHSEDYCFARAFDIITPEEGERRFPSIRGHETDRIEEMEKAINQFYNNQEVDSKDHRVVQSISLTALFKGKEVRIKYKEAVNKTWPQFWEFIDYCKDLKKI